MNLLGRHHSLRATQPSKDHANRALAANGRGVLVYASASPVAAERSPIPLKLRCEFPTRAPRRPRLLSIDRHAPPRRRVYFDSRRRGWGNAQPKHLRIDHRGRNAHDRRCDVGQSRELRGRAEPHARGTGILVEAVESYPRAAPPNLAGLLRKAKWSRGDKDIRFSSIDLMRSAGASGVSHQAGEDDLLRVGRFVSSSVPCCALASASLASRKARNRAVFSPSAARAA